MTETANGRNDRYTACIARQSWNNGAEVYACALAGGRGCPEDESCRAYRNSRLARAVGPVSPAAAGQPAGTG